MFFMINFSFYIDNAPEVDGPYSDMFLEPMQNITVPTGREAMFTCVVENAENYKVYLFLKIS